MTKKKLSVKLLTLLMLLSMLMQVIPAYAYAQEDEGKIQKLSDFKTDKEILEAKLNEDQSTDEKTVIDISSKNDIKEFIVVYQKTLALNETSLKSAEIEVDKEIKFYNVATSTKRVLELEGFDENEKDEGRTYDEAIGKLFEYLDKMERKKEIDRQEFENFVDGIAFSEKPKIFETLKWYIETNKIGFLELIEGERDRIYISEKEVLKVFEEIFDM